MRTALVLSFSPIASDPRVVRQVRTLATRFDLTIAGFGGAPAGAAEFIGLEPPSRHSKMLDMPKLLARRFEDYYWGLPHVANARHMLASRRFELVVANDVQALPLALELADGAPVLLDAHEFSPREFEDRGLWRLLHGPYTDWLCRRYLARAAAMTTVAHGIAEAYQRAYGLEVSVVHSAPALAHLTPQPVPSDRIRMVHHGAAVRSRRIEVMMEMMELLDSRFELDLMLVPGDARYIGRLKSMAQGKARIRVLPPVRMEEIVPFTNRYDIGLFLLPPANFNYAQALPNKFFEFIQARLAVAIGPSPEMKRLVERFDCGLVAPDFAPASLARLLSGLTPERLAAFKANSDRAATELCWEKQAPLFLAAVDRAMGAA
jgi:hypothetical protein